jgi:hypothetical protein
MENNQINLSSTKTGNVSIDTNTNKITIENNYKDPNLILNSIETSIDKLVYPSDISDLFFNIKEYLDSIAVNILDKTPRFQQIGDFSQLIYKHIPENKTDMIYNDDNKKYINDDGWQHV